MAEEPARVVRVVDAAVAGERETPRPRAARKGVLGDLHRRRVDARQFVGAELAEEGHASRSHHQTVRFGGRSGYLAHLDFSCLRVEPPDPIRLLHGEPDVPERIESGCVRVGILEGYRKLPNLAGPGVELADVRLV